METLKFIFKGFFTIESACVFIVALYIYYLITEELGVFHINNLILFIVSYLFGYALGSLIIIFMKSNK